MFNYSKDSVLNNKICQQETNWSEQAQLQSSDIYHFS